ncbi:MAG TPA: hypothetical protein VHQ42_05135 [Candidatus Limnocylindria bacterium]|nr:hypothetical protein [Candidatus Limnocylindria bacterium]
MMGRFLALCGWLAWQVGRPFRVGPLRRLGSAPVVAVAAILAVLAAAPLVLPFLDPQPEDALVQQIFDGRVADPEGWVRLHGRVVPWWLSLVPAILAVMLAIGARVGYPLFRPSVEVDVLSAPLTVGERIPAAYGGRVGPNVRDLADPGGALFVMRRAPTGDVLTAQPLPDDGGVAPQPVTVGGSWTSGRIGYVFTVTETVPALRLRTELVDATFLFARTTERDRVASMVTVER